MDLPGLIELEDRKGVYVFGRNPVYDVLLDSTLRKVEISRKHATLKLDQKGCWHLTDEDSTNGVYVNDFKISSTVLIDGDVIVFGGGNGALIGSRFQQPASEFTYRFETTGQQACKRKAEEQEEQEQQQAKVQKLESEKVEAAREEAQKREWEQAEAEKKQAREEGERKAEADRQEAQEEVERKFVERERVFSEREKGLALEQVERERVFSIEAKRREEVQASLQREQEQVIERLRADGSDLRRKQEVLEQRRQDARVESEAAQEAHRQELESVRTSNEEKMQRMRAEEQRKATESLEEEYTCSVCLELLVDAEMLCCGHNFCRLCVLDWLWKSDECPFCRKPVRYLERPIPAIQANNTADQLARHLSVEAGEGRRDKQNAIKKQKKSEGKREAKLTSQIVAAKDQTFLDIKNRWEEVGRKTFAAGVGKFKTPALRKIYSRLVSFDEEYIRDARLSSLKVACANLAIVTVGEAAEEVDAEELRRRLWLFLLFGCGRHCRVQDKLT
jgi:pSer/pThr/pTyr-binding forkhead associated (FHA) protein